MFRATFVLQPPGYFCLTTSGLLLSYNLRATLPRVSGYFGSCFGLLLSYNYHSSNMASAVVNGLGERLAVPLLGERLAMNEQRRTTSRSPSETLLPLFGERRPPRSQREILRVLREPSLPQCDSEKGQVDFNLEKGLFPSEPISTANLTSMDQFMTDQLLPNQPSDSKQSIGESSETETVFPCSTRWSAALNTPSIQKSTVDFRHRGSIIASVEISVFPDPSTMHKWKITSPSISPFQHYLGPINVNSRKECGCGHRGAGDQTHQTHQTFDKPLKSPFSISIRDRDVFNDSQKILTLSCFTQRLKLHKCLSNDAPLILTGMNIEISNQLTDKILLTGKNSKLLVHGNVGILKSKQGSIHVSQSINSASSVLGKVCCDTKSSLPWTLPHDRRRPQLQLSMSIQESPDKQDCILLHDCNLILHGNANFIMTSSEDVKIDGCCDSIETVWGDIYLTSRNIQKVLKTTGDVCVPSTCDVSQVHSKNIRFVDTCEE